MPSEALVIRQPRHHRVPCCSACQAYLPIQVWQLAGTTHPQQHAPGQAVHSFLAHALASPSTQQLHTTDPLFPGERVDALAQMAPGTPHSTASGSLDGYRVGSQPNEATAWCVSCSSKLTRFLHFTNTEHVLLNQSMWHSHDTLSSLFLLCSHRWRTLDSAALNEPPRDDSPQANRGYVPQHAVAGNALRYRGLTAAHDSSDTASPTSGAGAGVRARSLYEPCLSLPSTCTATCTASSIVCASAALGWPCTSIMLMHVAAQLSLSLRAAAINALSAIDCSPLPPACPRAQTSPAHL